MKALVTGDMGFVGSHLARELVQRGYEVRRVDLRATQSEDALDFFRRETTRFDLAFHCAAVIGGRASIDGTPLAVGTNLALDAHYFRWLDRSRTPRAVYFSSSAAYPVWLQRESGPLTAHRLAEHDINLDVLSRPDQTYGLAKLSGEFLAQYADGTKVTIVRPFSGYGNDQSTDYPFPSFIARARRRADPFEVWGDGEQVRDWIHIDDVVAGTLAAIEHEVPGAVNLCTGRPTSFNELAKLVTEAAGYSPEFRHLPAMPSGVHYRVGDPTKLLSFYEPKITLEEGIRRALA